MIVYLIGFMGVGKTTLGKKLAHKLNFSFIDLDNYIESKYKFSINSFFSFFGEDLFRKIEKKSLEEVSNSENVVISTGGGTPCFFDNIDIIKKTGVSIYLQLPPKSLLNRLVNAKKKRPLLTNKSNEDLELYIENTLQEREKYYLQADYVVEALYVNASNLLQIINNRL